MYLTAYIPQIRQLCERHKVGRLHAFGSVLTEGFSEGSDVDLVVDIEDDDPLSYCDRYFDLKFTLEDLFRRPVDLLERKAIKNKYLREEIERTGVKIYG